MCVLLKEEEKKKRKEKNTFLVFVPCAGEQRKKWKTYPTQKPCPKLALFCFEIVLRDVFLLPLQRPVTFERPAGDCEDETDGFVFGNAGCFGEREGKFEITESGHIMSQRWKRKARHLDRMATGQLTATPGPLTLSKNTPELTKLLILVFSRMNAQ